MTSTVAPARNGTVNDITTDSELAHTLSILGGEQQVNFCDKIYLIDITRGGENRDQSQQTERENG